MTSVVFSVENLTVTYGKKGERAYAVQDVSFSLGKGETLGIVGESGCGKTTAVMALMGLVDERAQVTGTMTIHDKKYDLEKMKYTDWRHLRGEDIAMVFQDSLAALNPLKKIGEQIAEAIYVKKKMSKKHARERAVELLSLVEIPDARHRAGQYPHECSGGMRQRVMIAMALANEPDILICDEPTTALDVTVQAQILEMIKRLQTEMGMAVLLVTHDLGVVNVVSDYVSVFYAGKIVETGNTHDVLSSPVHPYTHALMRAMPDLVDSRGSLYSIPGFPPPLNKEFTWCPFAPRCDRRHEKCENELPERESIEDASTHEVACFFPLHKVEE